MSKKIFFWIFLIIGIIWITGVSWWYFIYENNFDLSKIDWEGNFNSDDPVTVSFFKGVLLVMIPLVVTAFIFYLTGLFFGKENKDILKQVEKENENLKHELAEYAEKVENIKVIYTGGKIPKKNNKNVYIEAQDDENNEEAGIIVPEPLNVTRDDLKVIEGIGEKIEFILNENGIYTWSDLSVQKPEDLRNILMIYGGAAYKIHNTSTWAEQAKLAVNGDWEKLASFKKNVE